MNNNPNRLRRGNIPPQPPKPQDPVIAWVKAANSVSAEKKSDEVHANSTLDKRTRARGNRRIGQGEQIRGEKPVKDQIMAESAALPDPVKRKRRAPEVPEKPQPAKNSLVGKHRAKKLEDITADERIPSDIRQFLASLQK